VVDASVMLFGSSNCPVKFAHRNALRDLDVDAVPIRLSRFDLLAIEIGRHYAVTRAMRASGLDSSSVRAGCSTKSKRTRVNGRVTPSDS